MSTVPASVPRTKPHVLVVGQIDDEATNKYLARLGTGVAYTEDPESLRQDHYDFVIDLGNTIDQRFIGNATVLRFEQREWLGTIGYVGKAGRRNQSAFSSQRSPYRIDRVRGEAASNFTTMEDTDDRAGVRALVAETILPNIPRAGNYSVVRLSGPVDWTVEPMLAEENGAALAAIINFPGLKSYWSLPPEATDQLRWIQLFLGVMKREQPKAFPPDQVGLNDDWRTLTELAASSAVREHAHATELIMMERDRELMELERRRDAATEAADAGDRLLLTAQGELLEQQVADVLRALGFEVENRDEHADATQSSKKEDLRITHPTLGDANWVCLAEVKGFTKGAKANVILQIQKAAGLFEGQNHRPPSAQWYVVNHHMGDAAQTRPEPLRSNPDEIADFAKDGGLVIDTRWLFQLKKQVDKGTTTPEEAATALMEQAGTFTLPPENDVSASALGAPTS